MLVPILAALLTTSTPALDTAIARMGGADALGRIQRVRFETMTQWLRTAFDERPTADQPSYEWHSDLRDYTTGTWRNTRRYPGVAPSGASAGTPNWREIVDIVRPDVAIRFSPTSPTSAPVWAPLSVAYVDERREVFTIAPERALLAVRSAPNVRTLADTTMAGVAHARFTATVDGMPTTIFVRRSDGFLAMTRVRAEQPNDFGLAPWGPMDVEVAYSKWTTLPLAGTRGVAYPLQWDVRRVGRPYKRMTLLAASLDAVAPADSFAISDSLRAAFVATANKPMYDLPLDAAKLVEPRLVAFNTPGAPVGAVKLGRRWVLLEAGQAPTVAERVASWLGHADPNGKGVAAAVVTVPVAGSGGVSWLAQHGVALHVAPGAAPFVARMLQARGVPNAVPVLASSAGRWVRVDGDSLWIGAVDVPDLPGAALVYVPSLRWAYSAATPTPVHLERMLAVARARGFVVERYGSPRGMVTATPVVGP